MSQNNQTNRLKQTLIINVLLAIAFSVCSLMLGVSIITFADYLTQAEVWKPAATISDSGTPTPVPTEAPPPYTYPDEYEIVVDPLSTMSDLENDTDRQFINVMVLKNGNDFLSIQADIINRNRSKTSTINTTIMKFDETDDSIVPEIIMVNNFDNSLHSIAQMFEIAAVEVEEAKLYDYVSKEMMGQ